MPTYTYACECGITDEALVAVRDRDTERACPACKKPMRRLIEAPALAGSRDTEGKA